MDNIVHMEPSKEFFIEILTKDIKLERAIFDLIDNSIDAAKRMSKDLNGYKVRLILNKNSFNIEDNCGGISTVSASNYAFKFGNVDSTQDSEEYSVGHNRIGMKRAFFRIGSKIKVESVTKEEFFSLVLDVNKWRNIQEWSVPFKNKGINNNTKAPGTIITIQQLHKDAADSFPENNYIRELREHISKYYKDSIRKGITIVVNDIVITTSMRTNEKEIHGCFIDNKNYNAQISIKKDISDYFESGWYVYLNDRLVVEADKTDLCGWNIGDEEQYHMLRGEVRALSKKRGVLPFNTTKDGLDTGNPVYIELRNYMRQVLDEALSKIPNGDLATIRYEKPRKEVEELKAHLKVKSAKRVGEITYEEYLRQNNL